MADATGVSHLPAQHSFCMKSLEQITYYAGEAQYDASYEPTCQIYAVNYDSVH